jgi:hypothetical protein
MRVIDVSYLIELDDLSDCANNRKRSTPTTENATKAK